MECVFETTLKLCVPGDQSETAKGVWLKCREDRILVDHLLRQGHYSAALRLAQSSGTKVIPAKKI